MDWRQRYDTLLPEILREWPATRHKDLRLDDTWHPETNRIRAPQLRLIRADTRPALFGYQEDLVEQVREVISESGAALLSLPTGGGKTRTAVVAVLDFLAQRGGGRVVWLAPTIELIDQAIDTFVRLWRDFGAAPDVALTRKFQRRGDCCVWFTTPQAVNSLISRTSMLGEWDLIVFDEAHQLAARTYRRAVEWLRGRDDERKAVPLIGLSATPGRADSSEMDELLDIFGKRLLRSGRLGENPVRALQQMGVLAQLRFRKFTKRGVSDSEAERLSIAARACTELFRRGRHVLVFTGSVGGAYLLQDILQGVNVPARAVDSTMPAEDRYAIISAFERHKISVLVNQRLLATGYDCPAVTDVLLLTRIGSPILFEQIVGRAARGPRTGGSRVGTIWEFDDHLAMHGLPSSYYRYKDYDWS